MAPTRRGSSSKAFFKVLLRCQCAGERSNIDCCTMQPEIGRHQVGRGLMGNPIFFHIEQRETQMLPGDSRCQRIIGAGNLVRGHLKPLGPYWAYATSKALMSLALKSRVPPARRISPSAT